MKLIVAVFKIFRTIPSMVLVYLRIVDKIRYNSKTTLPGANIIRSNTISTKCLTHHTDILCVGN